MDDLKVSIIGQIQLKQTNLIRDIDWDCKVALNLTKGSLILESQIEEIANSKNQEFYKSVSYDGLESMINFSGFSGVGKLNRSLLKSNVSNKLIMYEFPKKTIYSPEDKFNMYIFTIDPDFAKKSGSLPVHRYDISCKVLNTIESNCRKTETVKP